MTNVSITKKNGEIVKVVCDGHTNYGVSGEDIVCSALSSIVQTAVLGVLMVAGVNLDLVRNEDRGYLSFEVPNNISQTQRHDVSVILNTMLCGISDLREGYSDFVELEVK
ncbi:MAG: ribosomal-processing cysteine protease Prp [Clostridia bacterium]|nr:ribosomal-processing cysteine protease Prp [Clostridia bacterium]MBQ9792674.1 ribosomal-processing cysteine protease Prp [Clostridia bacterium]MBR1984171.1 ribosomal-processing cysteine protease Prp [Clostridia bacterium]